MKTSEKKYNSDTFYEGVWNHLAKDFRDLLNNQELWREPQLKLSTSVPLFRKHNFGGRMLATHIRFKCEAQLENLFKRYRFKHDLYTEQELQALTNQKFVETQIRISYKPPTYKSFLVIQEARKITKKILGPFCKSELADLCRFGTKASVGNPLRHSYVDLKLTEELTGSKMHIKWFREEYLAQDVNLREAYKCLPLMFKRGPRTLVCDTLSQTNVPKSYKALRSICPNTTLGGLYTSGVGKMLEQRLRGAGLNLAYLQDKHKKLAQRYSETRFCVTADLSSASDSFVPELVNRLVPRDWYNALKFGRIHHVNIDGQSHFMNSFMTMGIGFTFPLQTLLFFSLLKAVQNLSGIPGNISVFGDDLIYPRKMHRYVKQIFSDINFVLNGDKTYVDEDFRESCGGDYYCGFDVRPFQPEGGHRMYTKKPFLCLLYKTVNGLRARWPEHQIYYTLTWIEDMIRAIDGKVYFVPPLYPDFSGIKTKEPQGRYCPLKQCIVFECLTLAPRDRVVTHQAFYYWQTLLPHNWVDKLIYQQEEHPDVIRWRILQPEKKIRSKYSRKRLLKLEAVTPLKGPSRIVRSMGVW